MENLNLIFEDIAFTIDVNRRGVHLTGNPHVFISLSDMVHTPNGYWFQFNPQVKRVSPGDKNAFTIRLPFFTELVPKTLAAAYGKTVSEVIGKTDYQIFVDQHVVLSRANGNLPVLAVWDQLYKIDLENRLLINLANKSKNINIYDLYEFYNPATETFTVPFDTKSKRICKPKDLENKSCLGPLVGYTFPALGKIDPWGDWLQKGDDLLDQKLFDNPPKRIEHGELVSWAGGQLPQLEPINPAAFEKNYLSKYPEQELPEFMVDGRPFLVDVQHNQILDKANPLRTYHIEDMRLEENGYRFWLDPSNGEISRWDSNASVEISMPWLSNLDPQGMAKKYNKEISDVIGKSDYEVIVDQEVVFERQKAGRLPRVEIEKHIFYAYVREGRLQPHGNFHTDGIRFDDIEDYLYPNERAYLIPYDPKKQEFREIDLGRITEFPKDLVMIEIPPMEKIDPIKYLYTIHAYGPQDFEINCPPQSLFKAVKVHWKETPIAEFIEENKKRLKEEKKNNVSQRKGTHRKM